MGVSEWKDADPSKISSLMGLPALSQHGTQGHLVEGLECLCEEFGLGDKEFMRSSKQGTDISFLSCITAPEGIRKMKAWGQGREVRKKATGTSRRGTMKAWTREGILTMEMRMEKKIFLIEEKKNLLDLIKHGYNGVRRIRKDSGVSSFSSWVTGGAII